MPFEGEHGESKTVAIALAELPLSVRLKQKGQVHKAGHCVSPAESLIKKHMQRRRREPFLTADNMGHLHQMVVHDIGQMICGQVIGAFVKHFVVKHT